MTATAKISDFATSYQTLFEEIIATVEGASDDGWSRVTESEQWPVGVVAHHLAVVQGVFVNTLRIVTSGEGELSSFSMEQVHANNAQHAHDHANATKAETLDLLIATTPTAVMLINSLREEQLDQFAGNFGGHDLTVGLVIEWIGIGHPQGHLESIKATLGN